MSRGLGEEAAVGKWMSIPPRAPPTIPGHHPAVTDAGLPAGFCPCELPDLLGKRIQFMTVCVCLCRGRFLCIAAKYIQSFFHFLDVKILGTH